MMDDVIKNIASYIVDNYANVSEDEASELASLHALQLSWESIYEQIDILLEGEGIKKE